MIPRGFLLALSCCTSLAGCNASTMGGFAEAAREDRMMREDPYAYSAYKRDRELDELRDEVEDLRRSQRRLCQSRGGYMIGSNCYD